MTMMPPAMTESGPVQAVQPTYDARAMTGIDGLARIVLDEKVYTLRITKAGKLILTK